MEQQHQRICEEEILVRIFMSEKDTYNKKPLYEEVIKKAKDLCLAGATVTRGILGFGAHSHIHSAKVLRLSNDLPIIIEIVDREEKVNLLLPFLDEAVREGLVTMEKVNVIKYRRTEKKDNEVC